MSTSPDPLVSFQELVLRGPSGTPARPFEWAVYPGEQWAITGPMASGKSLLARAVAGLGPLSDKGLWSVELGAGRWQVRSQVSYVTFDGPPQGEALFHQARWHSHLAVESPTVDGSLSIDNIRRRNPYEVREDRRPEELHAFQAHRSRVIADLDLAPLLERRLHHLSDGEWRRVRIGWALLGAPRLLVLDDPFTGLDSDFRVRLRQVLAQLMAGGTQLILVIPDLVDLPRGITHILALDGHGHALSGRRSAILPELDAAAHSRRSGCGGGTEQATAAAAFQAAETRSAPAIEMQGVSVVHDGIVVLQDVSWTVRRGERWALVGPNGAGKSTLLSLILGDHPQAYANRIKLFGRWRGSGESIWEIKRRIGWVAPELQRYFPLEVTTADLVASGFYDTLGLHRSCSAEQLAQVSRWLERFGLSEHAARPFRALSKGEQRLALIARALVKGPELLVLDEPCQGLDAEHVARVLQALGGLVTPEQNSDEPLRATAHAMIYVTHRPEEFPRNLTHILELQEGRVVRQAALTSDPTP